MPGVGPLVAMAVETFAPDMTSFHNGRDFAAWLGLVPRQFSSGGKERLGRISKAGQADIRQMLIIGAMSRLNWMRSEEHTSELQSLMRSSYAVFCLKKKKTSQHQPQIHILSAVSYLKQERKTRYK